jgi:two-component system OmpR family sensor kinase
VIKNLLQNAVVHGGATAMDVRVERAGDRVTLTARDNGRGATTEVLRNLGEAFGRRSATGKTGVGLFVSRQLAQRMRGDLRFASASGNGFTAVLELPLQ